MYDLFLSSYKNLFFSGKVGVVCVQNNAYSEAGSCEQVAGEDIVVAR
jgi:hypothetical protein